MRRAPDALIVEIMANVPDLLKPPKYLDKTLQVYGAGKVAELRRLGFLKVAPRAKFIECLEPDCFQCTVAVEEKHGKLFALCQERDDIARIPIRSEDVMQGQVDFFAVSMAIAQSLGREIINECKDGKIKSCYLKGYELLLIPGSPVCIQIADRVATLAECFRWTGKTFTLVEATLNRLLPAQEGKEETTIDKYCRILGSFIELKPQEPGVEGRYRLMATEFGKSFAEIKRLVLAAKKSHEVLERLGISKDRINFL